MKSSIFSIAALSAALVLAGCSSNNSHDDTPPTPTPTITPHYVLFFLGDGFGTTTQTATRIYAHGEDGQLTIDTLPETAWIRTYSHDAQVTDSAPSMSAYMTGVKMNNDVISMSENTVAIKPGDAANTMNLCGSANGTAASSLFESAKHLGLAVGSVTTTRVTHATPAATYAHICHRDLENDIAAQAVPGGTGYNSALGDGLDVLMGGGRKQFLPNTAGGGRTDGRDLTTELKNKGYQYVSDATSFNAVDAKKTTKLLGLFTDSHMTYDLDRDPSKEPSLAQMTTKAIDVLNNNAHGFALMVEGGRIDHALHSSNARRALQDAVAFDEAIKSAIDKMKLIDPNLDHTMIVVTSDHDHTLVLNGYSQRTGATTAANPGVLGLVKNVVTGQPDLDADGQPYTIIGFGNGEHRIADTRAAVPALTDEVVANKDYHQEAGVLMPAGSETHGGTDVPLEALGHNADKFHGFMNNTEVFAILRDALSL